MYVWNISQVCTLLQDNCEMNTVSFEQSSNNPTTRTWAPQGVEIRGWTVWYPQYLEQWHCIIEVQSKEKDHFCICLF